MKIFGRTINHSPSGYNESNDPVVIYHQWEHWKWRHWLQGEKGWRRNSDNLPDYLRIDQLEKDIKDIKDELSRHCN